MQSEIITYHHIHSSTSFPADIRIIQSVSNQSIILFCCLSAWTGGWKQSIDYFVLITVCINLYLSALDGCNNHRQESSFINDDFTDNSYNDSINLRKVCQVHFCTLHEALHEEGTQRFVNVDLFGLQNTVQWQLWSGKNFGRTLRNNGCRTLTAGIFATKITPIKSLFRSISSLAGWNHLLSIPSKTYLLFQHDDNTLKLWNYFHNMKWMMLIIFMWRRCFNRWHPKSGHQVTWLIKRWIIIFPNIWWTAKDSAHYILLCCTLSYST